MAGKERVGIGLDSHRYAAGRRLVLGGIEVPFRMGLVGHSDGDALTHAVADALLGALALGDLGEHFPPDDARWKGASSLGLLADVNGLVGKAGYRVRNVDCVVVAEEPRLGGYRQAMRERLASVLGVATSAVSVKFKSAEALGALGRVEGVGAQAVVSVEPVEG